MGRLFVIVGGFLVLLLTAALVIPPFINWTGYRADFEHEASRILGRPVHVAGGASARLLPFPSVTFTDVRVGADAQNPAMTVDRFSMGAELMPFLRGQILIFDMKVERPRVTISLDKDGRVDWAFRPSTPLDPTQIRVEKLTVSDGAIMLRDDANGRTHQIEALNAILSATSLAGPWQMNGDVVFDGEAAALDVTTGEARPEGGIRVRVRVSPEALPAVFETDGDVLLDQGRLRYSGQFGLRSADVARDNRDKTVDEEKPFLSDLRISGVFAADRQKFTVDEFRMEQGPVDNPYVVNGKAVFDYGSNAYFTISADGQQVFWGPAISTGEAEPKLPAVPFATRLAQFRRMMEQLPIPSIPGSVDLRLPAIIAGGTTIRTVTIKAEPDRGSWNIRQMEADLPGRTKVEAKGRLSIGKDFGFAGDLLVASRQPSGLAAWLTDNVDESIRRLPSAGFSGHVVLLNDRQQIDNLEVGLGESSLKGSFARLSPDDALPAIRLSLEGGAIENEALQALLALFTTSNGISVLDNHAVSIAFKAGPLKFDTIEAGSVDTSFRLNNGRFDFDRFLISDLAGSTITATGAITPFSSAPSGGLDATILSDDLSGLLHLLANRYPDLPLFAALARRADNFPGLFADSEINLVGNAVAASVPASVTPNSGKTARNAKDAANSDQPKPSEASLSVSGKSGGLKLDLSGTAMGELRGGDPLQMQVTGTAISPQGENVLALLGLPALPLGLAGELEADFSMQGAPSIGMRTQVKLIAPDGVASADGVITVRGDEVTASGKTTLRAADVQPFAATLGYTLPGFGTGLSVDVASDFQFAKRTMRFPNLAGKLDGEDVSAKIDANLTDDGLPQLRGEAKLTTLDLAGFTDIMLGQQAFATADGKARKDGSIWPNGGFAAASSLPLMADIKMTAATAELGGHGTIDGFSSRLIKSADELSLKDIAGNWRGGQLAGNLSLRNNDRNAMLSADLGWNGANLRNVYRLDDDSAPLGGVLKVSAKVSGNGGNMADLVRSMAGTATLSVEGLVVSGLNAGAMSEMLAKADVVADETGGSTTDKTGAKRFETIATAVNHGGSFTPGLAQVDMTIAGGIARVPAIKLSTSDAVLESDLQIDLSTLNVSANGVFTLKTGQDVLKGSEASLRFAISGPQDAPQLVIDRQPLVQFLTQRALEREQQRVEAMQAALTEKQALRREAELYRQRADERQRQLKEDEERRRADALARAEAEKAAAQQAAIEKAALEKAEAEKVTAQKAAVEKAALEKAEAEKAALKKAAAEKVRRDAVAPARPPRVVLPQDGQSVQDFLKALDEYSPD